MMTAAGKHIDPVRHVSLYRRMIFSPRFITSINSNFSTALTT